MLLSVIAAWKLQRQREELYAEAGGSHEHRTCLEQRQAHHIQRNQVHDHRGEQSASRLRRRRG